MDKILIDVGVYTALEVDLSAFDFTGIRKVILTVKNEGEADARILREFREAKVHRVNITPEESTTLLPEAVYDFDLITDDGKRYKNGGTGKIALRKGVGTWTDDSA